MLEKLQSGVADYDLVVPSDYMLKILIPQGLVRPLDRARLPHFKNLDPRFLNQKFDPGNGHSIPYLWGTTGIGYDKKVGTVDSWRALFDPEERRAHPDARRSARGLRRRPEAAWGSRSTSTDPAVLRQAAEMLKKQKPLVRTYNSSDFANLLAAGDVDLAHGYNGELAEVVANAPDRLAYVVPKEGGTLWIDNLAIPKGAAQPRLRLRLPRLRDGARGRGEDRQRRPLRRRQPGRPAADRRRGSARTPRSTPRRRSSTAAS